MQVIKIGVKGGKRERDECGLILKKRIRGKFSVQVVQARFAERDDNQARANLLV